MIYDSVRYIGLTIPVQMLDRKAQQKNLVELINNDYKIPTVIVSHALLFNELSILPPKSNSYNGNFDCENMDIKNNKLRGIGAPRRVTSMPLSLLFFCGHFSLLSGAVSILKGQ